MYNFYASIFELKDVILLHKFGKVIFVTFQGDDIRSPDLIQPNEFTIASGNYSNSINRNNLRAIEIWSKYANRLFFLNPDLKQYLPNRAEFLAYASVNVNELSKVARKEYSKSKIVFLHAPSQRNVKGTNYVIDVFNKLSENYKNIELKIVENIDNSHVLNEIKNADFVIDQLLAGWYGALAVEAMALGVPTIAWIDPDQLSIVPAEFRNELPILSANKENLASIIVKCCELSRTDYLKLSENSKKFVQHWHDPEKIAAEMAAKYWLEFNSP